ncbi:hypothetical protein JG551_002990 [Curtobacterium flaccumfaciens pv. flaccumfaciens]|uniref:hypothetical protein n=1 Tax=Curtobacterium flaccumfaciens TaxID=2035 RepID=UPI001BCB6D6E|nr:hypothetical protein [Curtobacterium flaccumfaciens]QVG65555.1 hypothetical protein JG551_002990 [Curtobacterium flaccumfaciens pv. flaccumfaciens]
MAKPFLATRRAVLNFAIAGGLVTLLGLILLEAFKGAVWPWVYSSATNVLGVLFGLAVVSLIWEFFVRRDHSTDLRHYLRLGSSVAKSGLQDVSPRSRLDWQSLLESANEVTVLTYDAEWLGRNSYTLTDVARVRPLRVMVAVPKADGAYLVREAKRRGLTTESLAASISEVVTRAARLWRDAKKPPGSLHSGSKLSVVEHELDLGYEVVTIDRTTIVTLAAPGDSDDLQDRVAFVYSQAAEEYPTSFFTTHKPLLESMNRMDEV